MSGQAPGTSPSSPRTDRITLRELLRDRGFLLYLIGQTTSGAGSALASVALVFAVLSISHSASGVGLVLLSSRLPGVALTLAGGVIADRFPRKWIAVGADATRTGLQLATALLLLGGHATVFELAALQFLSGGATALFAPAAGSLLAGLAPRGQIRRANALLGISTATVQTGALAISGVLVALAGPGTALLIDAGTFAVSTACLTFIPATARESARSTDPLADLKEGWRLVITHRWLTVSAVSETITNVLVLSPFFVLGPVLADDRLGGAPAWSGIALAYVIGNLGAAHITYHWAPRRPVRAALLVHTALAPLLALLGIGAPLWLILPAAFMAGVQATIYNTLTAATVQANLPPATLGRVSAITNIGSTVLAPLGMGLAGIVAGALGASTIMVAGAVLVLVSSVTCMSLPSVHTVLVLDRVD